MRSLRRSSLLALMATLALAGAAGCGTTEAAAVESGALTGSVGVLHVERSVQDGSGRTVLRAAFARYQGIDEGSVTRLLGSGSAAQLGGCALVGAGRELTAHEADVELLDVGALHVSVADTEARLSPRTFPDLVSVLAGVFYAGDAALAMPEPEVDEYRFVAEGSAHVSSFEVVVPAPAEPSGLQLVGADGTSAQLESRLTEVTRAGALTLQWDGDDPRDLVEIELVSGSQTLACLARDEGTFRIPGEHLASLEADPEARLVVRRVRVSPFDALGIDAALARVAATRSFPLAVR